jgi:hypothetical protein
MGFTTEKGKVTVGKDSSNQPVKVEMRYEKFSLPTKEEMEQGMEFPTLADIMEELMTKGVTEDVVIKIENEGTDEETKEINGISMVQLLADAFSRYNYNVSVAKEREKFNNSPVKQKSQLAGQLEKMLANPDLPVGEKVELQAMLKQVQLLG